MLAARHIYAEVTCSSSRESASKQRQRQRQAVHVVRTYRKQYSSPALCNTPLWAQSSAMHM